MFGSTARADGLTSDPAFVFLAPETSYFWRTATNSVMSLPVEFPEGATSATLGLIQGLAPGAEGCTRCIAPFGGKKWRKVENRAVMPIPYGTKAFSFQVEGGGEITETGLDGAAGWYAFGLGGGERAAVSMTDSGDVVWAASLMGRIGVLLFIR